VSGCERVNLFFASQLLPFVSRPDTPQIAFKNRVRLFGAKTFPNALCQSFHLYPFYGNCEAKFPKNFKCNRRCDRLLPSF
jgi:hypothetical protein